MKSKKEARRALPEEIIAEIIIDQKTRQIRKTRCHANRFRFKCQRCGVFCCKLGGPKLSRRDTNRLKQAGYKTSEFLNADDKSLRSKADGSCIFLSIDTTTQLYKCSVYSLRPTLCRLYPFHFEKSGHNSYNLILIPCCNGLNTEEGDSIDMNFLAKTVECTFSEMVDAGII